MLDCQSHERLGHLIQWGKVSWSLVWILLDPGRKCFNRKYWSDESDEGWETDDNENGISKCLEKEIITDDFNFGNAPINLMLRYHKLPFDLQNSKENVWVWDLL